MGYRIGVDVGGTFTDFLVIDGERSWISKEPTTPADPSEGFFAGLERTARDQGRTLAELLAATEVIVHGTTITTNATLSRTGAQAGFITTDGFRDALLMRRGLRERQYDCKHAPPAPLVPRHRIKTVRERVASDGGVATALVEEDVERAAAELREEGVEAVGVSFLFSFFNDAHERRAREILEEALPGAYITLSSEVNPQVRLYERNSTTALNAYVGPPLDRYLGRLRERLAESGFDGTLLVMQSNGGVMAPEVASRFAVNTLLSGPAAGPVTGVSLAGELGLRDLVTVDMGGTSFDVCLVADSRPQVTSASEIAGHHIATPALDIHTIGAGGGSIAWLDPGGMLRVGPRSAGADPGPACYGRGTEPTVTDADLVLGYLDPGYFHGGELELDVSAAERAIEPIADGLGLSVLETAAAISRVVNASMADGLRLVTVQRGHDPEEFALVAAGGAGPIHAAELARELAMPLTLVPRDASVFCAEGMLLTDLEHHYVATFNAPTAGLEAATIAPPLDAMRAEAERTLASEGVDPADIEISFAADVRYEGQFTEVDVPLGNGRAEIDEEAIAAMVEGFHAEHDRRFGYAMAGAPTEIVNLRAIGRGVTRKPTISRAEGEHDPPGARKGSRRAHFEGAMREVDVYDALALRAGSRIDGPAILEQPTTTIVVPPAHALTVAPTGSFLVHRADRDPDEILKELAQ